MPYYVYILTNTANTVLYTGSTNDLARRVEEHKRKLLPGFTSKYGVNRLVYYEIADEMAAAREREHQIKAGSRKRKMELIEGLNPTWRDLTAEL